MAVDVELVCLSAIEFRLWYDEPSWGSTSGSGDLLMPLNVKGDWEAVQGNGWHTAFHVTTEDGNKISGSANGFHPSVAIQMNGTFSGQVTDSAGAGGFGDRFAVTVSWGGGRPITAMYVGTLGDDHRISGITYSVSADGTIGQQSSWVSNKAFTF
jgi:hypothetical protein